MPLIASGDYLFYSHGTSERDCELKWVRDCGTARAPAAEIVNWRAAVDVHPPMASSSMSSICLMPSGGFLICGLS